MTDIPGNDNPCISVLLPVYNGGAYLLLSVNSVLEQTKKDFELLVLDDCSTDGSWEYIQKINDPRVRIFRNDMNRGLFYNLNFMIGKSNSGLIKLWAQDDIMYPDCLATMVDFHEQHPGIGFSYSGCDIMDEDGVLQKTNTIDATPQLVTSEMHARIAFFTGSIAGNIANVCISKKALESVGLFNENMRISADFDMWVRLAKDHDTGFIPQKLIRLRSHVGQLSRNESLYINHVREDMHVYRYLMGYVKPAIKEEGIQLLRKYKLVFYYTLMVKSFLKGKLKAGMAFYKELASFDNFFKLSISFIKSKIKKPGNPDFV